MVPTTVVGFNVVILLLFLHCLLLLYFVCGGGFCLVFVLWCDLSTFCKHLTSLYYCCHVTVSVLSLHHIFMALV